MRENKMTPVIIGGLCAILAIIIIVAIFLLSGGKNESRKENSNPNEAIAPIINVVLDTEEEDQDSVFVTISAYTEDEEGIDYIELPDGTKIFAETKDYEITDNGKYTFRAYGVNGASVSKTVQIKNIKTISANNPYIPEGFEHVGGDVDSGFVIQDTYGNQYVWIPVPSAILTRDTLMSKEYEEASIAYDLSNSVGKYYGFYIARFEASMYENNGIVAAASMPGKIPWAGVEFQVAYDVSIQTSQAFGYEGVETALVNSYAWDTTLSWLDKSVTNYSTNTSYGNYSGTIYPTGATESDQINNVCDMAGNVREWTTEIFKETTNSKDKDTTEAINRVIRGGSASINKIASSRNGYPQNLVDSYWGFRTILYKQ